MNGRNAVLIGCAVLLTFTTLYAPQPLLPLLAQQFQVSKSAIALLVSVTMAPLSLAPIAYGFLLASVPARSMLIAAASGLAITSMILATGPGYEVFLIVRLVQGLILPAMMTGLMTYVAATAKPGQITTAMATYVAMTIAGGFLGRAFSGHVAEWLDWTTMFGILGGGLAFSALSLCWLPGDAETRFGRVSLAVLPGLLRRPGLLRAYLTIFCAFFVFASLLNYLPFRVSELAGTASPGHISLMYTGYLMGIVVALLARRLVRLLRSERRVVLTGLIVYLVATLCFLTPSIPVLFVSMFVFCAGMFTVHSVLPGLVNQLAPDYRGVVNGLYLSAYYLGGTIGSFLPGLLLSSGGWSLFIAGLVAVLVAAISTAYTGVEPR
ncbi:MAG: MFS transporter [Marinobacter sp.]|nr:MFS transporter [Marinobacter sp.]